jgi:hypothetical protein
MDLRGEWAPKYDSAPNNVVCDAAGAEVLDARSGERQP